MNQTDAEDVRREKAVLHGLVLWRATRVATVAWTVLAASTVCHGEVSAPCHVSYRRGDDSWAASQLTTVYFLGGRELSDDRGFARGVDASGVYALVGLRNQSVIALQQIQPRGTMKPLISGTFAMEDLDRLISPDVALDFAEISPVVARPWRIACKKPH